MDSSLPTITCEKRQASQSDPDHDVQKRQRHIGNPAEVESQAPTSFQTPGAHATSLDTGFDRDDDASEAVAPHGTEGSLAHRATPVEAGTSVQAHTELEKAHAELVQEVQGLRETLAQTQSASDAMLARLQAVERQRPRMEGQLEVLIRMQQPAAKPTPLAQAPSHPRVPDPDMA